MGDSARTVSMNTIPEARFQKLEGLDRLDLSRRDRRTQPRVLTLGSRHPQTVRPHKALHRSAHLEKHPRQRVVGAERA